MPSARARGAFVRALAVLVASSVAAASSAHASVRPQGIEVGAGALGARTTGAEVASGSRLFLEKDGAGHRDSVHLYAGFANDPVNLRDPTGEAIPLVVAGVVALASLLAIEGVANAPDFGDATLRAPGAGEIIAKTAILAASGGVGYGVASGLGLSGFRLAVGTGAFGGASVGAGFQATDDVVAGQLSGVNAYVASTARGFYLGGLFGGAFYGVGRGLSGLGSRTRQAMSFDDIVDRGVREGFGVVGRDLRGPVAARGADLPIRVTEAGIARVEGHLGRMGVLDDPANAAMVSRLRAGQTTAQDINFYMHELRESALLRRTGGYGSYELERAAHLETLQWQRIPYAPGYESKIYHPDVIRLFSDFFNPAAWPK